MSYLQSTANQSMNNFKDALLLMRIPFSVFLMPIFYFACILLPHEAIDWARLALAFFIIHFLLYPASNGYNSYFDRDKGSIGGLEKPPMPTQNLFYLVVIFDLAAIACSLLISPFFFIGVMAYTMMSKAYSWRRIRLKKYPILSTLIVTFFQGSLIYLLVQDAAIGFVVQSSQNYWLCLVATLFLMGSYPITQIYQHQEDNLRGDKTLSIRLGIVGTFVFSGTLFTLASTIIIIVLFQMADYLAIAIYLIGGAPIILYFIDWFKKCAANPAEANFKNTMTMNKLSSLILSMVFVLITLSRWFI